MLPEIVYFKGEPYTGKAAVVNGYNGYTCAPDDRKLCALVIDGVGVPSCWSNGVANVLTDKDGIEITHPSRGASIYFKDGKQDSEWNCSNC